MPTNRTRIQRPRRQVQISDELLALYTRQQELEPIYDRCIEDDICRSDNGGHCDACRECIEITNKMRVLTRVTYWESSGVGADQPDPPKWMSKPKSLRAWRQAWQLHLALIEAAKEKAAAS